MKHSIDTLKNLATTAEKNAASWVRAAEANEKETASFTRHATVNRSNAASEQAKADDLRAAIALLEQANKPAEKWGVFFLDGLKTVRSEDFPSNYPSETAALEAFPTDWRPNYIVRRIDNV